MPVASFDGVGVDILAARHLRTVHDGTVVLCFVLVVSLGSALKSNYFLYLSYNFFF